MARQSSYNRLLTFDFWRDFSSTTYVFSLIALAGYGIGMEKPVATNSALAMGLCSISRLVTQKVANRTIANLQSENYRVSAEAVALEDALRQSFDLCKRYEVKEQEWASTQESLQAEIKRLNIAKDEAWQQLKENERLLQKAVEDNQEYQIEEKVWEEKANARISPLKSEIDRLKKVCEHYQKHYQKSVDECNAITDSYNELVAKYEGLVRENQALRAPKRLPGATPEQAMANQIADWLGQIKPPIPAHITQPAKINGEDWIIWIDLEGKNTAYRIKEFADFMRMDFGLPNTPTIKPDGNRVKITIHRGERLDEYGVMRTDPLWLKDSLTFEEKGKTFVHHARFSGESRSGKSTLISNAVAMLRMTVPQIQIELADPHMTGQSNWKSLTPAYKGQTDCLRGFQQFYQEFKHWDESKEENPTPRLFILDEFDGMSKEYPEIVANAVDLWKNGRHEQFYLWVVGQSAGVGRFNSGQKASERLYIEDTKNLIQIWLADAIDRGLSEVNEQPVYVSAMRQAWLEAKAKGQRFIALCRPITIIGRSFIALMPPEGCFQAGARTVKEVLEEADLEQFEARAEEFNIDTLERLYQESPSDPNPVEDIPTAVLKQLKQLIAKGSSTPQIILKVWGLKPNGKGDYPKRKKQVEWLREQS